MELPECPVCLQSYDGEYTIPRVLACGHSVCEACLKQLPQPFPHTIRCPACTQLVKYPHPQGPSALPKNIDLLRFSLPQNPNPKNSQKPHEKTSKLPQFIPHSWSDEFYTTWKDWVLPNDAVLVEPRSEDDEGDRLCSVFHGRIVSSLSSSSSLLGSMIRCCVKENQNVSLFRVSCSLSVNDSVFNFSYIVRVMEALSRMKDEKRAKLGLILRACLRQRWICKAYGLWYNLDDRCLYLVCERCNGSVLEKLGELRNGIVGGEEDGFLNSAIEDGVSCFAMTGMEICEAVIGLHLEGLVIGCLGLSCFSFNDFGHFYFNLSEILVMGRKVRRNVAGGKKIDDSLMKVMYCNLLKHEAFVSPELLFELLHNQGIVTECGGLSYKVGYRSDVWSLACILIRLLIGKPFTEEMVNYIHHLLPPKSEENGFDYLGLYKGWMEKVESFLETKLDKKFMTLQQILCKCLNFDPGSRPLITDVWKCIRELIINPQFDIMVSLEGAVYENKCCCLVLGELCQLPKEIDKGPEMQKIDDSGEAVVEVGEMRVDKDLVEGVSVGDVKLISMQGHLDCISGLAVGGGFLFSSSFDKTINVWSLQDFTHVHSFRGHENKVMAVVFVDKEQPMCISGDSGGGIFIWSVSAPFEQEPLKKWYEQKDWRYTGIHALAISEIGYLYTGSGDTSIKAWSLQDCTLSCTMNGHRSVVSSLAICDGVLYSGSWDGTIRLWSLNDHSALTVLGEDAPGNVISVLALSADRHMLVAAHENGHIKIWKNDVFKRSIQAHNGAIFALGLEGKWLFSGGWDKTVNVQELSGDEFQMDARLVGSIVCDSVITAVLYWQGKLFVGYADRFIKVYYYGH